ncbi:MAG: hypothetical protein GQ553_04855 [Nitrosomonadaceae bacterium]|nr:hypothetical protein [Nitrosomonadaceae bacterium]
MSHETVPDETYVFNWVVPEDAKCPTPDGEVICQYEFLTTTTSTSTTSSTTSTTSSTTTTVTFPPGLWIEAFDDLHWEDDVGYSGGHFTWTGTQWEQNGTPRSGRLSAIGAWYVGFQPTHIRISFTGPSKIDWVLESAGGVDTIGQATDYNSDDIVALDWSGGNDLDRLEFNWTNLDLVIPPLTIEFFASGLTTSSTTTTTTTSSTTTSSTTSSSSTTSTTYPYVWEALTGPEYWEDAGEPVPLAWDVFSTRWEAQGGGNDTGLQPLGTWSVGLRPTAIRMNYGPSHEVRIKDTNGDTIGYSPLYASGDPIPLTFGSFDIGEILLSNVDSNLVITKIELLLSGYITTTSSTTSSSSTTTTTTAPPKLFLFDEFDDASIDANWDSIVSENNGGTVTEQSDRLELLLNTKGKNESRIRAQQTGVKGFSVGGDLNGGFDIYTKVHIPTLSDLSKNSSGESVYAQVELTFSGSGNDDRIYLRLFWTGSQIDIRYFAYDGSNSVSGTAVAAISENEVWLRFYYVPKDGEIKMYYALTAPGAWTYVPNGKPAPRPDVHPDFRFNIQSGSNDSGRQILTWCEYVRDLTP